MTEVKLAELLKKHAEEESIDLHNPVKYKDSKVIKVSGYIGKCFALLESGKGLYVEDFPEDIKETVLKEAASSLRSITEPDIQTRIKTEKDFARYLKAQKSKYVKDPEYSWDVFLELSEFDEEYLDVLSVYEYKGSVFCVSDSGCDFPFANLDEEDKGRVIRSSLRWLEKQEEL